MIVSTQKVPPDIIQFYLCNLVWPNTKYHIILWTGNYILSWSGPTLKLIAGMTVLSECIIIPI